MTVKFRILRGVGQVNNRITDLDFRRADLGLFGFLQENALEGRGAQESWLIFQTESSEHNKGPFPCTGSWASMATGQHG